MIGPGDLDEYFEQIERDRQAEREEKISLHDEIMRDLADILRRVNELQLKIMGVRK